MTKYNKKRAAISWTGGKDCALALYEATELGYEIGTLVTFTPKDAQFLAHPLQLMHYQAKAMGFAHQIIEVAEPYKEGYERAITILKKTYGITTIITGDIAEVDGFPNWIRECSKSAGVRVVTPLWGRERISIINKLIDSQFEIIFSGVKKPWFTSDWVGERLDRKRLEQLEDLHRATGLDICGENGEYHTQVLDGPLFKNSIQIDAYIKGEKDTLMYIDIQKMAVRNK